MTVLVERSVHHISESWLRFTSLKKISKKRLPFLAQQFSGQSIVVHRVWLVNALLSLHFEIVISG